MVGLSEGPYVGQYEVTVGVLDVIRVVLQDAATNQMWAMRVNSVLARIPTVP